MKTTWVLVGIGALVLFALFFAIGTPPTMMSHFSPQLQQISNSNSGNGVLESEGQKKIVGKAGRSDHSTRTASDIRSSPQDAEDSCFSGNFSSSSSLTFLGPFEQSFFTAAVGPSDLIVTLTPSAAPSSQRLHYCHQSRKEGSSSSADDSEKLKEPEIKWFSTPNVNTQWLSENNNNDIGNAARVDGGRVFSAFRVGGKNEEELSRTMTTCSSLSQLASNEHHNPLSEHSRRPPPLLLTSVQITSNLILPSFSQIGFRRAGAQINQRTQTERNALNLRDGARTTSVTDFSMFHTALIFKNDIFIRGGGSDDGPQTPLDSRSKRGVGVAMESCVRRRGCHTRVVLMSSGGSNGRTNISSSSRGKAYLTHHGLPSCIGDYIVVDDDGGAKYAVVAPTRPVEPLLCPSVMTTTLLSLGQSNALLFAVNVSGKNSGESLTPLQQQEESNPVELLTKLHKNVEEKEVVPPQQGGSLVQVRGGNRDANKIKDSKRRNAEEPLRKGERRGVPLETTSVRHSVQRWFNHRLTAALLSDWYKKSLLLADPREGEDGGGHGVVEDLWRSVREILPLDSQATVVENNGTDETSAVTAVVLNKFIKVLMAYWRRDVIEGVAADDGKSLFFFLEDHDEDSDYRRQKNKGPWWHENNENRKDGNGEPSDEEREKETSLMDLKGSLVRIAVISHHGFHLLDTGATGGLSSSSAPPSAIDEKKGPPAFPALDDTTRSNQIAKHLRPRGSSSNAIVNKVNRVVHGICPPLTYFAGSGGGRKNADKHHQRSAPPLFLSPRPTIKEMYMLEKQEMKAIAKYMHMYRTRKTSLSEKSNGDESGMIYADGVLMSRSTKMGSAEGRISKENHRDDDDDDFMIEARIASLGRSSSPASLKDLLSTALNFGRKNRSKRKKGGKEGKETDITRISIEFDYEGGGSQGQLSHENKNEGTSSAVSFSDAGAKLLELHGPATLAFVTDRPWAALAELPHTVFVFKYRRESNNYDDAGLKKTDSSEKTSGSHSGPNNDIIEIYVNGCELMYFAAYAMTANGDNGQDTANDVRHLLTEALIAPTAINNLLVSDMVSHAFKEALKLIPIAAKGISPAALELKEKRNDWKLSKTEVKTMDEQAALKRLSEKLSLRDESFGNNNNRNNVLSLVSVTSRRMVDPTHPTSFVPGKLVATTASTISSPTANAAPKNNKSVSGEKENTIMVTLSSQDTHLARTHCIQSIADGFGPSTEKGRIGTIGGGGSAAIDNGDTHWSPELPSVFSQATMSERSNTFGAPMSATVTRAEIKKNGNGTEGSKEENSRNTTILVYASNSHNARMGGLSSETRARAAILGAHLPVGGDGEGKTNYMRNISLLNKRLYCGLYGYELRENDDDIVKGAYTYADGVGNGKESSNKEEEGENKEEDPTAVGVKRGVTVTDTKQKNNIEARHRSMPVRVSEGLRGRPPYWSKTIYLLRALLEKENESRHGTPYVSKKKGERQESTFENNKGAFGSEAFDDFLLGDYFKDLYVTFHYFQWKQQQHRQNYSAIDAAEGKRKGTRITSSSSTKCPASTLRRRKKIHDITATYNAMITMLVDFVLGPSEPLPITLVEEKGRQSEGVVRASAASSSYRPYPYGHALNPPLDIPDNIPPSSLYEKKSWSSPRPSKSDGESSSSGQLPNRSNSNNNNGTLWHQHRAQLLSLLQVIQISVTNGCVDSNDNSLRHAALAENLGEKADSSTQILKATAPSKTSATRSREESELQALRLLSDWFETYNKPLLAQLFGRFLSNGHNSPSALFGTNETAKAKRDGGNVQNVGSAATDKSRTTTTTTTTAMRWKVTEECFPAADIHLDDSITTPTTMGPQLRRSSAAIQKLYSDGSWLNTPNTYLLNKNIAAFYGVPRQEWEAQRSNVIARLGERNHRYHYTLFGAAESVKGKNDDRREKTSEEGKYRWRRNSVDYCYAMLQADVMRTLYFSGVLAGSVLVSYSTLQKAFDSPIWAEDPKTNSMWAVEGGMVQQTYEALITEEANVRRAQHTPIQPEKRADAAADESERKEALRTSFFKSNKLNVAQLSLPRRLPDGRPLPRGVTPLGAQLFVVSEEDLSLLVGDDSEHTGKEHEKNPKKRGEGTLVHVDRDTIHIPAFLGVSNGKETDALTVFDKYSVHSRASLAFKTYARHWDAVERRASAVATFTRDHDLSQLSIVMAEIKRFMAEKGKRGGRGRGDNTCTGKAKPPALKEETEKKGEALDGGKETRHDGLGTTTDSKLCGKGTANNSNDETKGAHHYLHDYVLWIDNDAIITNMTIPLEALIANTLLGSGGNGIAYGDDTKETEEAGEAKNVNGSLKSAGGGKNALTDDRSLNALVLDLLERHRNISATSSSSSAIVHKRHKSLLWTLLAKHMDEELRRSSSLSTGSRRDDDIKKQKGEERRAEEDLTDSRYALPFDLRIPFDSLSNDKKDTLVSNWRHERLEREREIIDEVVQHLKGSGDDYENNNGGPPTPTSRKETLKVEKAERRLLQKLHELQYEQALSDEDLKHALLNEDMPFFADVPFDGEDASSGDKQNNNNSAKVPSPSQLNASPTEDTKRGISSTTTSSELLSNLRRKQPNRSLQRQRHDSMVYPPEHTYRRSRYHDALASIGAAVPYLVGKGINPNNKVTAAPYSEAKYALRDALSLGGTMARRKMRFLLGTDEAQQEYAKILASAGGKGARRTRGKNSHKKAHHLNVEAELKNFVRTPFEDKRHRHIPDGHASSPHEVDVITASQSLILNNGVFFLRNSPWIRHYWLPLWWHSPNHTWMWYDNGGFIHTFSDECVGKAQAVRNRKHLAIAPGRLMNAYYRGGNFLKSNLAAIDRLYRKKDVAFPFQYYQPGDWAIHFPTFGPYELQNRFFCESLRRNKYLLMAQGELAWEDLAMKARGLDKKHVSSEIRDGDGDVEKQKRNEKKTSPSNLKEKNVFMSFERYPLTNQCRRDLISILDMILPTN